MEVHDSGGGAAYSTKGQQYSRKPFIRRPVFGYVRGGFGARALRERRRYSYADYKMWDDDIRREIIDGQVYMMSSPNGRHQKILGTLYRIIDEYLTGKTCVVFPAAYDVRLFAMIKDDLKKRNDDAADEDATLYEEGYNPDKDESDEDVVQPDIVVICNQNRLFKNGCHGAPDLFVEILSPSNEYHDKVRKLSRYCEAGVREYWVIDPVAKTLTVHVLTFDKKYGEKYISTEYGPDAIVKVGILDALSINLAELFVFDEAGRRIG
jgi:Uma2 family endonuclease